MLVEINCEWSISKAVLLIIQASIDCANSSRGRDYPYHPNKNFRVYVAL